MGTQNVSKGISIPNNIRWYNTTSVEAKILHLHKNQKGEPESELQYVQAYH
jgi:hypothetical protein